MASLPTVGGSNGTWGNELNAYLSVEHDSGGYHNSFANQITFSAGAILSNSNLELSDPDVAHGMTSMATTSCYGLLKPISGTAGGLHVEGLSDTDAIGLYLRGVIGTQTPTTTRPAVNLVAGKTDGATGGAPLGSSETVLLVSNWGTSLLTILGDGRLGLGTTSLAADALIDARDTNDGGAVRLDLSNEAGSGSTNETVALRFTHTSSHTFAGQIESYRVSDFSSAANTDAGLKFSVVNDDTPLTALTLLNDGGLVAGSLKSGATAGGAGAGTGELWVTASHATLPDGVVMQG